jgi:hypothetical protein
MGCRRIMATAIQSPIHFAFGGFGKSLEYPFDPSPTMNDTKAAVSFPPQRAWYFILLMTSPRILHGSVTISGGHGREGKNICMSSKQSIAHVSNWVSRPQPRSKQRHAKSSMRTDDFAHSFAKEACRTVRSTGLTAL